jgi:pimeloyl-ACP methyl ester carboxylesterase
LKRGIFFIKQDKGMKSLRLHQLLHDLRDKSVRLSFCLMLAGGAFLVLPPNVFSRVPGCDTTPTDVAISDYDLEFETELMPDPALNSLPAQLHVHRVKPVYANGKCNGVPNLAVVLVHGRSVAAAASFDVRLPTLPAPEDGAVSLQEALARAGIDTFAPDLLGYGFSTRLVLDDPCSASLAAYNANGSCSFAEGCDRSSNTGIFPLNQQARYLGDGLQPAMDGLGVNPLAGERCEHASPSYFASMDVWARDIMQVIDDAIERAQPRGNKVVLLGYSLGGPRIARTLYLLGTEADQKVRRAVFLSSLFNRLPGVPVELNLPTEEAQLPSTAFSTFPLALGGFGGGFAIPLPREGVCTGRVISGVPDELREQMRDLDPLGLTWGGSDPENPTGLNRLPTFSNYGWNRDVAATFTLPTLVLHGLDDVTSPVQNSNNIFDALTAVTTKVLVQVDCGSHQMQFEGCAGARCDDGDPSTKPYGQSAPIWDGPKSTIAAAVVEWVKYGTFASAECGRFVVNANGIANEVATPNCPGVP